MQQQVSGDQARINEICEKTGLSEYSLAVYAAMTNKSNPIRINNLFRIVCPNRDGIRSLSSDRIRAYEASLATATAGGETPKKAKKSADEWRHCIIKEREKEIMANGVKVAGTTDMTKKLPPRQREFQLIWEFTGWAQTSANFYVYVYYVGPQEKGVDYIELTRPENWHIVPESHLVLFHKHMGDVHNFFQQTPFDVKESVTNNCHIEYDVRYILHKWKKCRKPARLEHIALVEANRGLFEPKDTLRVKNDKKRSLDAIKVEKEEAPESVPKKSSKKRERKRAKTGEHVRPEAPRVAAADYEVKTEKYRRVYVNEYSDVAQFPLGVNGIITFDARSIDLLLKNAMADPARKPATYQWDPTEKIIKPWMIATSVVRLRRQIVQQMLKKYNLCFESSDFDAIHRFIATNKEAADDVRRHFDMFTWSYSVFNILTMRGFIPDVIDDALQQQTTV